MKIFTNLPGNLRAVFAFLRGVIVILGFGWLLNLIFSFSPFNYSTHVSMTAGDVTLQVDQGLIALKSGTANHDALTLTSLRGTLLAQMGEGNEGLVAALHRTVMPAIFVMVVFSYMLVTSLRNLCANIEAGEIFTKDNLRLIRGIGFTLVSYSLANIVIGFWSSAVMGNYLAENAILKDGLGLSKTAGSVHFDLPQYFISNPGGLLVGCLVLMLTEAFRQGLALKTENDLTV
ncbi:MAG TPA: DUF2975 domain-containing protein [Lacunisphaera sp.]|jgi:hypothetical protein